MCVLWKIFSPLSVVKAIWKLSIRSIFRVVADWCFFFSIALPVNDSIILSITYQISTLWQANLACSCKYIQIFFGLETSSEISHEQGLRFVSLGVIQKVHRYVKLEKGAWAMQFPFWGEDQVRNISTHKRAELVFTCSLKTEGQGLAWEKNHCSSLQGSVQRGKKNRYAWVMWLMASSRRQHCVPYVWVMGFCCHGVFAHLISFRAVQHL